LRRRDSTSGDLDARRLEHASKLGQAAVEGLLGLRAVVEADHRDAHGGTVE